MLFSNPSLDDTFLESFLSLGDPWKAMDPEQRFWALNNLAANEKLRKRREAPDNYDGWDDYMSGKPFIAAWSLIENLEPSAKAAAHLSRLLRNLPAESYKTEGITEAIERWRTPEADAAKEKEDNEKARLSDFQAVRQAGARLLAGRHDATQGLFLDSDDIAIRCGAYEGQQKLDAGTIKSVVERDGDLARIHLIRNKGLWRTEKGRDMLLLEVRSGEDTEEPFWEYRFWNDYYRKEFPTWFKDEDNSYSDTDDRPITENSIADVVSGITSAPAVRDLHERITSLENSNRHLFWMLVIALTILVSLRWP